MRRILLAACLLPGLSLCAQQTLPLTVEQIMQDPSWIGTSPSRPRWPVNGERLYFDWNPVRAVSDSLYMIDPLKPAPQRVNAISQKEIIWNDVVTYNKQRSAGVFSREGDVFYFTLKPYRVVRITETSETESNPAFSYNDTRVVYQRNQQLFAWDIQTGATRQLVQFQPGDANERAARLSTEEEWLKKDQLSYMQVVKERADKNKEAEEARRAAQSKPLRKINIGDQTLQDPAASPNGRFITYRLVKQANAKNTIVPNYVTESGYTTDIPARTKVGSPLRSTTFYLYDTVRDTVWKLATDSLPGIYDTPAYLNDYPSTATDKKEKKPRETMVYDREWNTNGSKLLLDIRSQDNKDRWLMLWDTASRQLSLVERQHDDAWIGGPATSQGSFGWIDDTHLWYLSEYTGFSHLYTYDVIRSKSRALTGSDYEVQQVQLSIDKKNFYLTTNQIHPGEKHFYRMSVDGKNTIQLTKGEGAHQVYLSPDEQWMAVLYSGMVQPWELYLQKTQDAVAGKKPMQLTNLALSDSFKKYAWQAPELIRIVARDGKNVYARVYKPADAKPNAPLVFFVHGAGYLQNAHKWWSSYFREFMFNNLLAQKGYYVVDMDYRGSAGYGRNWRTGIYRHMGGKDLTDHVDAIEYMRHNYKIDTGRVGLYGGSYGGFITLMALFTQPGKFKAGAALRPVTDWANYNHGYTANILNEPQTDSIAYRRSSPIYHAAGLRDHLLICHGMVDVNVHYQDVVKLAQRLIELGKDNWELASYPMEDHAFVEPSSWTDEYKRILKLFETILKKDR
jgi:dipeptidyl aminopeptidase/acylaminoacyl peptidase